MNFVTYPTYSHVFERHFELTVDGFNLAKGYTSEPLTDRFDVGVNRNFMLKISYFPNPMMDLVIIWLVHCFIHLSQGNCLQKCLFVLEI